MYIVYHGYHVFYLLTVDLFIPTNLSIILLIIYLLKYFAIAYRTSWSEVREQTRTFDIARAPRY